MTPYGRILKLHKEGLNNSAIAIAVDAARKTVIDAIKRADECNLDYNKAQHMSDTEIHRLLHPKKGKMERMPDLDACFYRLALPGQSISALRSLYVEECVRKGIVPYSRAMFQNIIAEERNKFNREYDPTLELLFAKKAVVDKNDYLSLLFYRHCDSDYVSYTRVQNSKTRTWIHAIIKAIRDIGVSVETIRYLGRLPSKVKAETNDCIAFYGMSFTETGRNEGSEFAEWVSETIRSVNSEKSNASRLFLIRKACNEYNQRPFFQNSKFTKSDAHSIAIRDTRPLPDQDYDLIEYTKVKPYINFHVKIDGVFYSVPFSFRHDKLTAYVSDNLVEIYYGDAIVAVHSVLNRSHGKYNTDPSHLPKDCDIPYGETSGRSLRSWARDIGLYTYMIIDKWLTSRKYEAQAYIQCNALLHMSDNHKRTELEEACKEAWEAGVTSYTIVIKIIKEVIHE